MADRGSEDTLVIRASTKAVIIFIHGLGQTNRSWAQSLQVLANKLPYTEWVLPQARNQPVTYSEGRPRPSWFDIENLPPYDHEFDEHGISESIRIIEGIILAKIHNGADSRKIVLAGFSQGAALSMMVALTTLHDLGGVACLSGWIPHRMRDQMVHTEPRLPIFWAHGNADEEIPLSYAKESVDFLTRQLHIPEDALTFNEYEGLRHETNELELEDFSRWLSARLFKFANVEDSSSD